MAERAKRSWNLDSGCSRHMTGDIEQFVTLEEKEGRIVTFGNNGQGYISRIGNIQNHSLYLH